jgi:uncharacterized protein
VNRIGLAVLRHPKAVAAATIALAAVCVFGLTRLRIDPNVEHLLPPDDPTLRLTRHLQGETPPTRVLLIILRADDASVLEESIPDVAAALRGSPYLARVDATRLEFEAERVAWVRRAPLYFLPESSLDELQHRLTGPGRAAELEKLPQRLAVDPLGGKATVLADALGIRWIFDDASRRMSERLFQRMDPGSPYLLVRKPAVAFLRALGREESPNTPFAQALVDDVRSRIARATSGKTVTAELAGSYVSAVAQAAALRRDMIVEITVSTFAVVLFVWWFTRSLLAAHLVFVPVGLAIATSLAVGGGVFGPLTPIVMGAAAILIAQGVDFPVHYFVRYRNERRTREREEALHSAQVAMVRPFSGIAATTLAAFLALLVSRFPGMRQFGFVLALGIVVCLLAALLLFPVLLMPVDRLIRPASERIPWVVRWAGSVLRTRWRVVLAWSLVGLGAISWVWVGRHGVRMDLDLRNAMAPGDPGREALERLEKDFGASLIPVYALVEPGASTAAVRGSSRIAGAAGPQDLLPEAADHARVALFRQQTKGWVEGTLADLARMGFRPDHFRKGLQELEAVFAAPAPTAADLDRPEFAGLRRAVKYEEGGRTFDVLVLFPTHSVWNPEERREFDGEVRARLGSGVRLFSPFHLPDHYSEVLNSDLLRIVLITAAGIVVLTLVSVGSLRDGFFALVPVVLATGMTLGAVVLMGGRINVINMAAIPIILAVGVDGGIHFMVRFRESRDRDPAATIQEVGPGIWGSAATTLLGFGSIASSMTPGMASMGYLVVVGTVTSVLASLFLLPGLLRAGSRPPA